MALEKLTKIDGGGISTTSDYRVGVITATKFVGPVEGSITATDASFSGNVSIGGTLTYEDVTNIDSVGLVTARNGIEVSTGTATTALVVSGDARVTGILTVGTGSLTLDGPNNLVNVGTALTLGHTQGLQFHTQNLHSAGFEVNQINTSGIITATGADINGDLDVDGHTNLDNVSVAGVSTFNGINNISGEVNIGDSATGSSNNRLRIGAGVDIQLYHDSTASNNHLIAQNGHLRIQNDNLRISALNNTKPFITADVDSSVKIYHAANEKFRTTNTGAVVTGILTATDLDIDGHTNLDNLSVAGVSTFSDGKVSFDALGNISGRYINLDQGNGTKYIDANLASGNQISLRGYIGGSYHHLADFVRSGLVRLTYNGNGKLETTNRGIKLFSGLTSSGGMANMLQLENTGNNNGDGSTISFSRAGTIRAEIQAIKNETANNETDFVFRTTDAGSIVESLRIVGDNGNIQIPRDGAKIKLGVGDDLQLYHTGSHSHIQNYTGEFRILGNQLRLKNKDNDETYISCNDNGAVELYHNNAIRLKTTGTGVDITNTLNVAGIATFNQNVIIPDNKKILFGADDDLQIYHDTQYGHSFIKETGSGGLIFATSVIEIYNAAVNEKMITANQDGAVKLYHNGSQKLDTRSGGVGISGDLFFIDSSRIYMGSSNDYYQFHDGSNTHIVNATGNLVYRSDTHHFKDKDNGDTHAKFIHDGAVELYHNGTRRFFTYSDGVHIDTGILRGDDNAKIALGSATGGDLKIYHNGVNSFIEDSGTGALALLTSQFVVKNPANSELFINAVENAQVELYHNNLKKLSTISTGIEIHANEANNANIYMTADEGDDNGDQWILQSQASTNNFNFYNNTSGSAAIKLSIKPDGDVGFYGDITVPDDKQIKLGAGSDLRLFHRSSDNVSIIQELGSSYLSIQTNGNKLEFWDGANSNIMAEFFTGGGAYLRHGATTRFNTTSTGTKTTGVHEVTGILNLPTTDAGITFGPGSATNDYAHIEWKGGDNAGYLRISTDDDSDASGANEYIEFGDYATQNRGGAFEQHCRISRDQFLIKTGGLSGTSDRFKVDDGGVTHVLNHLNVSGITTSTTGFKFGTSGAHYLYQGASDTVSLRVTSNGPYAEFKDVSGDLQIGSASGTLRLSTGGAMRAILANSYFQVDGDIYMSGELNLTNGGNKNRFIDACMDDGESLILRSTQGGDTGHENMASFTRNGACSFHFDASSDFKFQTAAHGMNVHGDIHIGGSNTSTNQNRKIYWTGFDKEASGDNSDTAEIRHAQNIHGIAGSVLEIEAQNDANDGIALNACDGLGTIAAVCKKFDVTGYIEPSPGGGDNGIKWQDDPYGGSGDIATMQYYQDGTGENTRLRILVGNDADDDMRLEASTVHVQGSFSAATNKGFRIPHPLIGLTTTTDLVHTAVEGPQADLIYRGRAKLVAGISTVNIDVTNNMTDGTFVNLNRDVQCFTSNETGWTAVKGSVTGNLLTIIAQDNTCTDTISWMVVGERWDLAMYDPKNPMTAENGKIKTEIPNSNYNKSGFVEDYIHENKYRVGISTFSRPSIENKEVE